MVPSHTMRVLHVIPATFGETGVFGGAERYAFELARAMSRRVQTRIVAWGRESSIQRVEGLEVHVLGGAHYVRGQRLNPISLGLLPQLLWADVVHCHQQRVVASTSSLLVGRALGKRVFVSDLGGGGWDLSLYVTLDKLYDGHLHISGYSARLKDQAGTSKHVIFGGVDTDKFHPPAGGVERERTVLYVGRILPHKGIELAIRALPEGMKLKIAGTESSPPYLAELKRLAVGKDVEFLHGLSDLAIGDLYRGARAVVLLSLYEDMFGKRTAVPELLGQTLLEGMASETPAICTNVASMPEIVTNDVTGYVVEPGDVAYLRGHFEALRDNDELVGRLGAAARADVEQRFVWQRVVERCLDIYAKAAP